jgi:hypothetical protein
VSLTPYRFDPREGRWAPVTPLSAPRYDLAAAALGTGRLLALGGVPPPPSLPSLPY